MLCNGGIEKNEIVECTKESKVVETWMSKILERK